MHCLFLQNCGEQYSVLKRKCDRCGSKVERILQEVESRINTTSTGDKYINIGETKKSNNCSIQCGEPILLNPNSYENLELIMGELYSNLGIGVSREWSYVGCDGPPYCLASRLIEREKDLYDWIVMLPGLGHLNIGTPEHESAEILF